MIFSMIKTKKKKESNVFSYLYYSLKHGVQFVYVFFFFVFLFLITNRYHPHPEEDVAAAIILLPLAFHPNQS